MKSHDKAFLISGMMFNAMFFLAMMLNIFITNAAAIALLASILTYLFFDKLFYAQKKTDTHANE
ncbi:DUF1270 family protein [Staphylococcus haemolyticus]|uniref:DUF1270 family protein n=1 Tax=Staphylococcus haemolyticus TaxID=1283 RepID=UPI0011A8439B|nr:DUF1270 family protein [Staphylococcus haemolyticus]